MATHDQLRAQILDQLRQEGVTDPAQIDQQLRSRLHDAMEQKYGEMNGPGMVGGAAMGNGSGMGQQGMGGGAMNGTGYRHGPNAS